jgi:hypothetical protein
MCEPAIRYSHVKGRSWPFSEVLITKWERLELRLSGSTHAAGERQVVAGFRHCVKRNFATEERGFIDIQGQMKTYFLDRMKKPACAYTVHCR